MKKLVMNILDVQKFESAKMKIDFQPNSPSQIIADSLDQVPLLLDSKNIKIVNTVSQEINISGDS